MSRRTTRSPLRTVVLLVVCLGIGLQTWRIVSHFRGSPTPLYHSYINVSIAGDVLRPGRYRIPEGTSQFELLKVAGVRPTSNLAPLFLYRQIEADESITVPSLDTPVSVTASAHAARLEFYHGLVSITSAQGRDKVVQEGVTLAPGDRLRTESGAQAEISLGQFSRASVDVFSDVIVHRAGEVLDNRQQCEIEQRGGSAWYQIVHSSSEDAFSFTTPHATGVVGASGAEYLLEVSAEGTTIHMLSGLLLVDRPQGGESLNLIAGQTLAAFADERPLQTTRSPAGITVRERYSELEEVKKEYLTARMPLSFLFMGIPSAIYLVHISFESATTRIVQIPPRTSVAQFAQGFSTLAEAYLHGEAILVTTLVEQMLNTRITHYAVVDRDGLARTAAILGGVTVSVDNAAASALGTKGGRQKLDGSQLARFLAPSLPGVIERQEQVLKAVFDTFRTRNFVITALSADQLVETVETNFTPLEILRQYRKFTSRKDWSFSKSRMPTRQVFKDGKTYEEPDLDAARQLLFATAP